MNRPPARRVGGVCTAATLALTASLGLSLSAGESALTVADLAAYRAALAPGRGAGATPRTAPVPVGFRELWEHPATYQGRRVQVEGRPVRRFRQGAFGTFPPLAEAWVFSPSGDPFCLVFPATPDDVGTTTTTATRPNKDQSDAAGQVRFAGTFLKLLEYQGGDGPRLAPLIVGPAPPVAVASAKGATRARAARAHYTGLDWAIGLAAAALVAMVLAHQHLRRPFDRSVEGAPGPLFDDAPAPRRPEPG